MCSYLKVSRIDLVELQIQFVYIERSSISHVIIGWKETGNAHHEIQSTVYHVISQYNHILLVDVTTE